MFLSKIEMQGFKSFATKTVLEFPEKSHRDDGAHSTTAIVGPNGSGKSNTADAIRWVLGEQSVKLLRGKRADDVIFAGSESKARLGFAEVSLYLNNEDHSAPIDYTEIVITRRVYRDGEGEYLINKNKVRLFDILMLLAKANFGQKSYSIIGQGMVDHIIAISPWERKEFFDEATGVKQYQIKRDQSVNRLNRAKENLDQTHKILVELEPRLRLLTRQVKKLEQRKEVETQLRGFQEKYYATMWQQLKKEKSIHEESFGIKDALKREIETQLRQTQEELATLARAESRQDSFDVLQKGYNELVEKRNDILKELTMIKGKMSLEYVKAGKQNVAWLDDKKAESASRLQSLRESLNQTQTTLTQRQLTRDEHQASLDAIIAEITVLQNNVRAAQDEVARVRNGRSPGNFEAVRAILSQKSTIKGIYGTVSELGVVDERYQSALATAAGGNMMAVIVENEDTAIRAIDFLKANRLGTVTFFPLNKIRAKTFNPDRALLAENGAIGYAIDLMSVDEKFKTVFQYVFGSTVVVDSLDHAKVIGVGRERMVTLDGDVLERSGAMRGGFRRAGGLLRFGVSSEHRGSAAQKLQDIAVMQSKIEDRLRQREHIVESLNKLRVDIEVNGSKARAIEVDIVNVSKELTKLDTELAEQQIAPHDQDRYLQNLTNRRGEVEQSLQALDGEVHAARVKIDAFNAEEEKKRAAVFRLQDSMQSQQIKLNEINSEVGAISITLAKLETKQEDLEKEVVQELGGTVQLDALPDDAVVNEELLWLEISKLKKNLELIGGIDPEIIDEHREVSERYEFLSTNVRDLEKAIVDLEKIIGELDAVIEKQFSRSFKQINKSFEKYFKDIFQGGKAKLTIVQKEATRESEFDDDVAESTEESDVMITAKPAFAKTGVDIYVSPPNKKLHTISALSGGERTMTSLALLCAIIDSNPSPFVVMDEVDAALDEANSHRFAHILQELSYKTQFLIITHNRVVMQVADVLYGVAMDDHGVSKTLSLDLKDAEKIKE